MEGPQRDRGVGLFGNEFVRLEILADQSFPGAREQALGELARIKSGLISDAETIPLNNNSLTQDIQAELPAAVTGSLLVGAPIWLITRSVGVAGIGGVSYLALSARELSRERRKNKVHVKRMVRTLAKAMFVENLITQHPANNITDDVE